MSTEIRTLLDDNNQVFFPLTTTNAIMTEDGEAGVDTVPTPGSHRLVESGGVAKSVVYDISAANNNATYANLHEALTVGTVPSSVRSGGMSVKFVQTSDNKYVQWRYMGTSITDADFTNVANWQGVDEEPTFRSNNLVKSGGLSKYSILGIKNEVISETDITQNTAYITATTIPTTVDDGYLVIWIECDASVVKYFSITNNDWRLIVRYLSPNKVYLFKTQDLEPSGSTLTSLRPLIYADDAIGNGHVKFHYFITNNISLINYLKNNIDSCLTNINIFGHKTLIDGGVLTSVSTINSSAIATDGSIRSDSTTRGFSVILYSVTSGDNVTIKGDNVGYNALHYAFYSSQSAGINTLIELGSKFQGGSSYYNVNEQVIVPEGATILAVSHVNAQGHGLYGYSTIGINQYVLENAVLSDRIQLFTDAQKQRILANIGLPNFISDENPIPESEKFVKSGTLFDMLYIENEMSQISTISSTVVATDGSIRSDSTTRGFSVILYSVTSGDNVTIKGDNVGYNALHYAFYSSEEIGLSTLVQLGSAFRNTSNVYSLDEQVIVPEGATILAVSHYYSNGLSAYGSKQAIDDIYDKLEAVGPNFAIKVENSGKAIRVTRNYPALTPTELTVNIAPAGPNNLTMLQSVYYKSNGSAQTLASGSDNFPLAYTIVAQHDGNSNSGLVGGYHGFNGNQTGTPTARTADVKIYIDDIYISSDGDYYGDDVQVVCTNYIQAGNTKEEDGSGREVVKETCTYHFNNNQMFVTLELEALEDVTVEYACGMGITGYDSEYDFIGDEYNIAPSDGRTSYYDTGNVTRDIIGYVSGNSGDLVHSVRLHMDDIGLGRFKYILDNVTAFCLGYGASGYSKAYFRPVKSGTGNAGKVLLEGERAYLRGYYEWSERRHK